MTNEKELSIRDLYLAATLVTLKFYMSGVDFQFEGEHQKPIGYFKFENTPQVQEVMRKYWQGFLAVEPKAYVTNIRGLKAEVTSFYKKPSDTNQEIKK